MEGNRKEGIVRSEIKQGKSRSNRYIREESKKVSGGKMRVEKKGNGCRIQEKR